MKVLLLVFLAAIGLNWPELPYNARLADLIFLPLAIAVLRLPAAGWTWRAVDWAVAAYLLGAVPSILVSPHRLQSAIELGRELYLVAIYAIAAIAARGGFARTIATGLMLGGALLSGMGLLFVALQLAGAAPWPSMGEVMQLPYIGATLRLRALTASEAMLACVLTAAVPFAITACRSSRDRFGCAAAGLMSVAVAWTFSHAVAGFAVAAVMALWRALAAWQLLRRAAAAAAVVLVLGLNFAATASIRSVTSGNARYADASQYHHAVEQREISFGGVVITYDVMSYARIKQVAWRTFVEHPIAGAGLDQFHSVTRRAFDQGLLPAQYREIDPHSTLLGRMAESGIIGGLTLLLLWIGWAAMARDVRGSSLGLAAAAALAGLFVAGLNADVMNFRFLWVIAGLMRGLQEANGIVTTSGRSVAVAEGTR